MLICKSASTPADCTSRICAKGTPFHNPTLFRSIVGALQYATVTRPEISFAVNRVCRYMHSPMEEHWVAVKRILRYLKGTLHHGLILRATNDQHLFAYCDAGWAGDLDYQRSHHGYAVYFGGNLVNWTAKKQTVVASTSCCSYSSV